MHAKSRHPNFPPPSPPAAISVITTPSPVPPHMSNDAYVLGFASDAWSPPLGTWYDTHIGGVPVWPPGLSDLVLIPPCPRCQAARSLVLQAYAPSRTHTERAIYVLACNSIVCAAETRTWCALRVCRVEGQAAGGDGEDKGEEREKEVGRKEGSIDWDTDSGSGTSEESDLADDLALLSLEVELASEHKQAAVLGKPNNKHSKMSKQPAKRERHGVVHNGPQEGEKAPVSRDVSSLRQPCAAYYVEVDFEPPASKPLVEQASVDTLLQKYRQEENSRSASGTTETWAAEKEDDESVQSLVRRNHEHFSQRVARAPSQILRYKFGGQPLWPKYPFPDIHPDAACDCGSHLTFELQLLGSCLHFLQPDKSVPDHQTEAGMNFASIAVFTCAEDCTTVETVADNGVFKVISQTVRIQLDDW